MLVRTVSWNISGDGVCALIPSEAQMLMNFYFIKYLRSQVDSWPLSELKDKRLNKM
jgi:hypothetical protein